MKSLRTLVLALLAILLPVRGVIAAAMLCPGQGGTATTMMLAVHGHHELSSPGGHVMHDAAAASHQAGESDKHPDDGKSFGTHSSTCLTCASGCCMADFTGAAPLVGQAIPSATVTFPAFSAPVPAFHSDGPERPPRAI